MKQGLTFLLCLISFLICDANNQVQSKTPAGKVGLFRAQSTLDSLYRYYSAKETPLLRENYPFDENYSASYLASENKEKQNPYSYLWPFSGTFSAVSALYEASGLDRKYVTVINKKVIPGLKEYFDRTREPFAYSSYINSAPASDRFYDDNVWIGIDYTDSYLLSGDKEYLKNAELVWKFIESGTDDRLDGGIYWCEQKKYSKNACSNAPGAVYALKLYEATNDELYFQKGKKLYEWTKSHLQDSTDYLYFDNMSLNGKVGRAKFAYNSGQMLQAASILYKITKDTKYLKEAQSIAASCYGYFFDDFTDVQGESFRLLKKGNIWFTAVMFRGFIELYEMDKNQVYINAFRQNLEYAWQHSRDERGLFSQDWSGQTTDASKWLLTQAAFIEMYARLAAIDRK